MGRIATYITAGNKLGPSQSSNRCPSKSALTSTFSNIDASKLAGYANNQLVAIENIVPVSNREWLMGVDQILPYMHNNFRWQYNQGESGGSYAIWNDENVTGSDSYQIRISPNTSTCPAIASYTWVKNGDYTVSSVFIDDLCPEFLVRIHLNPLHVTQIVAVHIILNFSDGFTSGISIYFERWE